MVDKKINEDETKIKSLLRTKGKLNFSQIKKILTLFALNTGCPLKVVRISCIRPFLKRPSIFLSMYFKVTSLLVLLTVIAGTFVAKAPVTVKPVKVPTLVIAVWAAWVAAWAA